MGRHGEGSWDTITRGNRTYARFRITIAGRTVERTGPNRPALEKEAESLRARARRRLISDDEEITLAVWALEHWLDAKRDELGAAGAKTIRNYESALNAHIIPTLGPVKIRDLRAEHRRRLRRSMLAKKLKASTINVVDGVLRACLQAAADEDLPIVASAVRAVKPVKGTPEKRRTLSTANVQAILATAVGSIWSALWTCFAYTGARDAEVRALRWADLDGPTLTFRRQLPQQPGDPPRWQEWIKGRKIERVVPVVAPLAAALREHRTRQVAARLALGGMWCEYDLIFPDEVGRALGAQRVNYQFAAACQDAGVATWKGLGVHKLRGAANEILRDAGVDAPTRAQLLGHTVAVNEGYYLGDNARLAAEAMDRLASALGH